MHAPLTRRRTLQTLFCSSVAMALNLTRRSAAAVEADGMHFLAIGDFGTGGKDQQTVAKAMQDFIAKNSLRPEGLLLLGDNFYGPANPKPKKDGKSVAGEPAPFTVESARWQREIEDMYPQSSFGCPMFAVLGNHDYHDNKGGENTQLAYAKKPGVRWRLPAKWYRQDFGPLLTVLFLDTNLREVSGRDSKTKKYSRASLTEEEGAAQAHREAPSGSGATAARTSATRRSGSTPSASPSKERIRRWRRQGGATARTSSKATL